MKIAENGCGSTRDWVKTITTGGLLIASGAIGWATMRTKQDYDSQRITKVETKADASERAIIAMQRDIEYIKVTVDRNVTIQTEILKAIRNIP